MEHVVLLPHVGSASHHTRRLMGQLVVDNLTSWFSGKGPLNFRCRDTLAQSVIRKESR